MSGRILCIEDNPDNGDLFNRMLTRAGYSVIVKPNGIEGLAYARQNPVDLILMDINLPQMNGFQILQILRSNPAHRHIPVIAITAGSLTASRAICLQEGFDDYMTKPVIRKDLLQLIAQTLEKQQAGIAG